jgi:hypothetical protein
VVEWLDVLSARLRLSIELATWLATGGIGFKIKLKSKGFGRKRLPRPGWSQSLLEGMMIWFSSSFN